MNDLLNLSPEEWTAVRLSIRVATVAMLASLPVGIAVAYLLARARFPGKSIVNGIVLLPLIMPPVVTGYLLLLSFGRRGPIGAFLYEHFGIVFSFRWTGAALACAVMAFPLLVRSIRLSIEAVDRRLEDAAGDLHPDPNSRRRERGTASHPGVDRHLDGSAPHLGIAGAAGRRENIRTMSLAVDVTHRFGSFLLEARFVSDGRLTAFFGRSGPGKTSLINIIAGVVRPD